MPIDLRVLLYHALRVISLTHQPFVNLLNDVYV